MAKRTASSDLNHDNWDREDDPEDAGSFQKASDDTIKNRVIKVAKRRNPISSMQNDKEKTNVFGAFTGFSKTTAPPATTSAFSFLSNLTGKTDENKKINGTDNKPSKPSNSEDYYAKLKGLNESVLDWIKKHVTENPFINLQPVFKDYDKYFAELEKIEQKSDSNKPGTSNIQFNFGTSKSTHQQITAVTSPPLQFNFKVTTASSSVKPATTSSTSSTFSFGNNTASTGTTGSRPAVSFSNNAPTDTCSSSTATLSFGDNSKTSFSFGNPTSDSKFSFTNSVVTPISTGDNNTEENDEDEPPKVEFTPVVEEGHIYTVRCKVFVKKDGSFSDRGVGNLYLKPVPSSEKVQLIVRADTNLGNLLCNFILSEGIPTQRMGKKDVMLVCLPTPDTQPPPVPILLRVKTSEDADELLETLNKHKK